MQIKIMLNVFLLHVTPYYPFSLLCYVFDHKFIVFDLMIFY
jgi:hypothetical protein